MVTKRQGGGGHAHRVHTLLLKRRVLVQVTKGASGREMYATVGSVGTRTPHEPSTLFLHRHQRPRRVNLIATPQRTTTATTITAHPMSTRRDTYKPTNTQHQTSAWEEGSLLVKVGWDHMGRDGGGGSARNPVSTHYDIAKHTGAQGEQLGRPSHRLTPPPCSIPASRYSGVECRQCKERTVLHRSQCPPRSHSARHRYRT